ncbi:Class I glutamine amidotransferase-like protein [Rhizoctonia solani]|uniref:Class I glutamine amidotransferase-like protein n=1 Tax=Rhizoctonia solani TaxID=456999 RepID=A0A8H7H2B2_9AGAM|nr:Class I glutamine amidotransferase-like protein [Rhizoctonia solani]
MVSFRFLSETVLAASLFSTLVSSIPNLGPMELLGFLTKGFPSQTNPAWPYSPYEFEFDYLAESLDPVVPNVGPAITPTKTFGQVNQTQYDIILVPGGPGTRPSVISPAVVNFVKYQTPGLQYLLSVCTGAWVLANAGVLEGKNATTNKAAFAQIRNETSKKINWIPRARWVVDGSTWTSSGVTAGMDMANAFIKHLVGPEFATKAVNTVELRAAEQDDDPFAEVYGLV